MTAITFTPRILYLSQSLEAVRVQLAGVRLTRAAASPLRDDISTDEILPLPITVHFDEALGRYPYTGYTVAGHQPIGVGAIQQAQIEVVVGGKRYGKGSSREDSPVAEQAAGVRLIIAESFEHIYQQNADNLGLFTSTNFALLERITRGQAIELDELLEGRDAVAAARVSWCHLQNCKRAI
jgi:3-isopropylmalate/(R)-2-methylmalate dehydratase large subunit